MGGFLNSLAQQYGVTPQSGTPSMGGGFLGAVAGDAYSRYKSKHPPQSPVQGAILGDAPNPVPPMPSTDVPGMDTTTSASMDPSSTQTQWNQPSQGGGGSSLGSLAGMMSASRGTLVTRPTIARLGESGPEMVVPLKPPGGSHLQPDILEGRLANPHSPGIHYSRYRSYNRLGGGQGGAV